MADVATGGGAVGNAAVSGNAVPARAKISDFGSVKGSPAPVLHQGVVAEVGDVGGNPGVPAHMDFGTDGFEDDAGPGLGLAEDPPSGKKDPSLGEDDQQQPDDVDPLADTQPGSAEYQALKAKWEQDDLHPELSEKWTDVTLPDGGKLRVQVKDLQGGFLRNVDYSNKLAQVSQLKNEVMGVRAGQERFVQHVSGGDPNLMLQALGALPGAMQTFEKAAELFAVRKFEELELRRTNPQAYALLQREQQAMQRADQAERLAQQREWALQQAQQQAQPAPDQSTMQTAHQLQQMVPLAMQRLGIDKMQAEPTFKADWTANAEKIFELHFQNMLPSHQGPLTTEFVMSVMQATAETVQQRVASMGLPTANPRLPPPSQGLAGRAPVPGQQGRMNGQQQPRGKIGEMGKLLSSEARNGFRR